jgi:uracil phosphoribosyltransferase
MPSPLPEPSVHLVRHPLAEHALAHLRDKRTGSEDFKRHARLLTQLVAFAVTADLPLQRHRVETPLARAEAWVIPPRADIILVPVLRAGLSMLDTMQALLPGSRVGFVGLERDERTAVAREYYRKLPRLVRGSRAIILDPMLATGGSALATIALVREQEPAAITLATIIAAPEGVRAVNRAHPEVAIYTVALDDHLNRRKFIVPGLGDYGDRYYGTT